MNKTAINILGWAARILGTAIFLFAVFMISAHIFGDGEPGTDRPLSGTEIAMSAAGICTVIGLGLALFREFLGGLLATLGMLVFFAIQPALIMEAGYFGLALLAGILYLLHWFLKRKI